MAVHEQKRTRPAVGSEKPQKPSEKRRASGKPAKVRTWRTRVDAFAQVWPGIKSQLEENPGLEAKTIFVELQREHGGKFSQGQLRTLQRKISQWRALEGPPREVYFPQEHHPGELAESDFTRMNDLNITMQGEPFPHMMYHFVLTYSNWETGTLCFSESFASLGEGIENALWELGGVPKLHGTDRLTAAVNNMTEHAEFQRDYQTLLLHYGMEGRKIHARRPEENGDIEQRHYRFKRALNQALLLRGNRDFSALRDYEAFLAKIFEQLNRDRGGRLAEEIQALQPLPERRLNCSKKLTVRVSPGSLISFDKQTYSVNSRLIGEQVDVHVFANHLEVWFGGRRVEQLERLQGSQTSRINYRHIIGALVRKPGALANYRYREQLFPTINFRRVYDYLQEAMPRSSNRRYLEILELAAQEGEVLVDEALRLKLLTKDGARSLHDRQELVDFVRRHKEPPKVKDPYVAKVDPYSFDCLLTESRSRLEEAER